MIGIVASRLVERYGRPTFLIAWDGDSGRGSGRSIPGFDLHGALHRVGGTLEKFGGHSMAVGLTVRRARFALPPRCWARNLWASSGLVSRRRKSTRRFPRIRISGRGSLAPGWPREEQPPV